MSDERPSPELTVADLGRRPSTGSSEIVHELRVFDASGGEWSGQVAFKDVHDGRDTPEQAPSTKGLDSPPPGR